LVANEEFSEGGSRIYRHQQQPRSGKVTPPDEEAISKIEAHMDKYIGGGGSVFHEVVSDLVHIDIHMIPPSAQHPYRTLVTTGMSDRPMFSPKAYAELRYAELVLCLPPDWPVEQGDFKKEENYWPFRLLKALARLPHEYRTWLWATHTVPNGDPPKPYAKNTKMVCALLAAPVLFAEEFRALEIHEAKTIHFHSVIPLYAAEMELKLQKGSEALYALFAGQGVSELLNPARKSVVAGKRLFGLF
jgi:hypothetical protein